MRTFVFREGNGRTVGHYGSIGATVMHLLRIENLSVVAVHLAPHGLLGRHPASSDQLFLVVAGSGQVAAEDDDEKDVAPGTAVLWTSGEMHETRAGAEGLMAIIIEGEGLRRTLSPQLWTQVVDSE